jgi:Ca-activated chloride channel homolog
MVVRAGFILASLLASSAYAGSWWLTPDQEAQRALDAGNPSRAAQLFTDPQHRAYAEIEAKQYAEAARRLEPLADPQSQYNRGNALARAGDLPAALSSYDAALKHAPGASPLYRDAKHNRDLVAQQLEQQKQAGQQSKSGGDKGQKGAQQGEQQGQKGDQQGQNDQQQGQQGQGSQQQAQSAEQRGQSAQQQGQSGNEQEQKGQGQKDQEQKGGQQAQDQSQSAGQSGQPRDNQEGGANQRAGVEAKAPGGEPPLDRSAPRVPPPSEQALSKDQWLRQIPDDPAGLLRRKFMIEHMMKQDPQP